MAIAVPATLRDQLERGLTLPASWYSDPEIARLEQERIFRRSWQYAGVVSDVAEPGSVMTRRLGELPVVVVRDRAGELRGFVNVCRHRGHEVASGCGRRETLQCRYHAWTYDLDGTLRAAPRSEREPGFSKADWSLRPVAVETWGPLVFVNPDIDAAPLAETLGAIPAGLAAAGLDPAGLEYRGRSREWVVEANWKIVVENYLECYHCPAAHPGFSKVINVDPDAYALAVSPTFSSQIGPVRAAALNGTNRAPYVPVGEIASSQYHFLWPATTINIVPGPQNISVERWIPDGTGRTIEVTDYWFGRDVPAEIVDEVLAFDKQVGQEDVDLVVTVQAGLNTGTVPQGRLMRESEQLIADFQRRVYDAIA